MVDTKRDDAPKSPTASGTHGSGSDTLSAARISAGTSVGTVGQPARPHNQGSMGQGSMGQGSMGQGSMGQGSMSQGSMGHSGATGSQGSTGQGSTHWNQGQSGSGHSSSQGEGLSERASQMAGEMGERAEEALNQASDWAQDQYERGSRQFDRMRDQSMQQFRQARGGIERLVNENPLMVGLVGLAAGLVIGALLPRTRQEDRAFGQWADQVRDQGWRYARQATQRGRDYMEEAFGDSEDDRDEWQSDQGRGGIRSSGPRYQNH